MKKEISSFLILLTAVAGFIFFSSAYAYADDNLENAMKQFKTAQIKLRELRQSNASPSEIVVQEAKIKILRTKVSEILSNTGQ